MWCYIDFRDTGKEECQKLFSPDGFKLSPRICKSVSGNLEFEMPGRLFRCGGYVKNGDANLADWAYKSILDLYLYGRMATEFVFKIEGGVEQFVGFCHVPAETIVKIEDQYFQSINGVIYQEFTKEELKVADTTLIRGDFNQYVFIVTDFINRYVLPVLHPLGYLFEFSLSSKNKEIKELKDELHKHVVANLEKDDELVFLSTLLRLDSVASAAIQIRIKERIRYKEENESLKQENAALKLEVQKLKGLIEEAKKHVGMANLMLA